LTSLSRLDLAAADSLALTLILRELLLFLGEKPFESVLFYIAVFICGDVCLFSVFSCCFLLTVVAGKYSPPVVSKENEAGKPMRETGESN